MSSTPSYSIIRASLGSRFNDKENSSGDKTYSFGPHPLSESPPRSLLYYSSGDFYNSDSLGAELNKLVLSSMKEVISLLKS